MDPTLLGGIALNSSYILATKVCGSELKTQLLNNSREVASFFVSKFSMTHLWYKISYTYQYLFTNEREYLQSTISLQSV